jgi:hypothetical protein
MLTARQLLAYITDVAIADSADIAAEFGLTEGEANNAAWNADLHWTMGADRDDPVLWQPRWGEDLLDNLNAYRGDLDAPLSLTDFASEAVASTAIALVIPSHVKSEAATVVMAPVMDVHVTELERAEAQAYLASGYSPRLETTIGRIADKIVNAVRDLTVGGELPGDKPRFVTCRAIMRRMDDASRDTESTSKLNLPNYNTVRKVANALGATGRLTRKGGGKGGQWKFGVPA